MDGFAPLKAATWAALKERKDDDIEAIQVARSQFNAGLHLRETLLKHCISGGRKTLDFEINLRFLNRFFDLDILYPARSNIDIDVTLQIPDKIFFLSETDVKAGKKYRFQIADMYILAEYATLEESMREQYYSLVSSERIVRTLTTSRTVYRLVKKGTTLNRFVAIGGFGLIGGWKR